MLVHVFRLSQRSMTVSTKPNGFRPSLEALEDRSLPSAVTPHKPHSPPPSHVGINHLPPFIFNPFHSTGGISVPTFSPFANVPPSATQFTFGSQFHPATSPGVPTMQLGFFPG